MVVDVTHRVVTRPWGFAHAVNDLGPHDHLSWSYRSRKEWRTAVCAFFFAAHDTERLMYSAPGDFESLWDDLATLPDRDDLHDSGRLIVMPHPMPPGDLRAAVELVDSFSAVVDEALKDFTGIRLATRLRREDMRGPAPGDHASFAAFELFADRVIAVRPIAALCGVDQHLPPGVLDTVQFVHPRRRAQSDSRCAAWLFSIDPEHWALAGEIDISNRDAARTGLASLALGHSPHSSAAQDRHLDLRHLIFIDAATMRTLLDLARALQPHHLVLHHPPPTLRRLLATARSASGPRLDTLRLCPAQC